MLNVCSCVRLKTACTYTDVCVYIHLYVRMYVCMYVGTYVSRYIYIYINIHTHTHIRFWVSGLRVLGLVCLSFSVCLLGPVGVVMRAKESVRLDRVLRDCAGLRLCCRTRNSTSQGFYLKILFSNPHTATLIRRGQERIVDLEGARCEELI